MESKEQSRTIEILEKRGFVIFDSYKRNESNGEDERYYYMCKVLSVQVDPDGLCHGGNVNDYLKNALD